MNGFHSHEQVQRSLQPATEEEREEDIEKERINKHPGGGILMLINQRMIKYIKGIPKIHDDKRTISVTLAFPSREITVYAVYSPADSTRSVFWQGWRDRNGNSTEEKLVIGDFNVYSSSKRDTWSVGPSSRTDFTHFNTLLEKPC